MHALFKRLLERSGPVFIAHYHCTSAEIFFLLPRHIKTSDPTPLPSVARASAHTPRNCLSKSANRKTDARAAWRAAGIVLTHEKSARTGTLQPGDTATTAQHLPPQQGHQLQLLEKMAQENIPA